MSKSVKQTATIQAALEQDFARFLTNNGQKDLTDTVNISVDTYEDGIAVSLGYPDDYEPYHLAVKPYVAKLKKQFGWITDGEGDDTTRQIIVPVDEATTFVTNLVEGTSAKSGIFSEIEAALERDYKRFRAANEELEDSDHDIAFSAFRDGGKIRIVLIHDDLDDTRNLSVSPYIEKLRKKASYLKNAGFNGDSTELEIAGSRGKAFVKSLDGGNLTQRFNTVVFTGKLSVSRTEAKAEATKRGFIVSETVNEKTDYVVVGEKAGAKEEKAKELGVSILTEDQWKHLSKRKGAALKK